MQAKFRLALTHEELLELDTHLAETSGTNPMLLKILTTIRVQLVKIEGGVTKPAFTSTNPRKVNTLNSVGLTAEELRHAAYTKLQESSREALNSAELELADTYMYFNDLLSEEEKTMYEERYLGI